MSPGTYLARRRVVSGHSLRSLALAVIAVERFGQPFVAGLEESIIRRIAEAEGDRVPLCQRESEMLASFILIDPGLYRALVDFAARGAPAVQMCRVCGASAATLGREPFSGLPGYRAHFIAPDLCSLCDDAFVGIAAATPPAGISPVGQALRDVSDLIARMNRDSIARHAAESRPAQPPFLRLVPKEGDQ